MGTDLTGPVEVEGKGVFPTGALYDTVEHYEFTCTYAEEFRMIVAGHLENGIRFEGDEGWLYVSYQGIDAQPKALLDSVIGPDEIHLYESNDHKGNFIDCIRSRKPTVSPAQVAQRSVSVGHLGVAAIKLGRKLKWDPEKERFCDDGEANRLLHRPMRAPWYIYSQRAKG
jgi:hypothetical protein